MPRSLPEGVAAFKEREERTLEMKMKTLAVLAGVASPLIATGSASAGFIGIKATSKPNDFGLLVVNVYAIFDRPEPGDGSGDHMVAVAGTPNAPLVIQVTGGTFYNHPFGNDHAPLALLVDVFPSLAYDTFVTIGVKKVGDPKVFPGAQPTGGFSANCPGSLGRRCSRSTAPSWTAGT